MRITRRRAGALKLGMFLLPVMLTLNFSACDGGGGLRLQDNGSDTLSVTANGALRLVRRPFPTEAIYFLGWIERNSMASPTRGRPTAY